MALADLYHFITTLIETASAQDLRQFEIVLSLITEQAKEVEALKNIVKPLASDREELTKKIDVIEKRVVRRERTLRLIDEYIKERKRFLNQNR